MQNKKLLIITDVDQCVYSYSQRRSLAEIAHISSDIPPDEDLIHVEVAFVLEVHRPERIAMLEELCEYAREYGGIQRVVGVTSKPTLSADEMLKLATRIEQVGAEFAPQFV